MTLGDRVAVLRKGLLQQVASPRELYEQPVNMFVAGFIGSPPMNFLPAVVEGDRLKLPFLETNVPEVAADKVSNGQLLIAGIRPEHFEDARVLDSAKRDKGVVFRARVDVTEWLGDSQYAYIPFESNPEVAQQLADLAAELDSEALRSQLIVSIDAMSRLRENHEGEFWANTRRMHLFDPRSGENLTRDEAAAADLARFEQEELRERMDHAR
jgi:multiple sugar transport system ATP-binding protein